ncbi:MAG: tetratricopeptide repeat protein [Gemmatimonadales bacterium]
MARFLAAVAAACLTAMPAAAQQPTAAWRGDVDLLAAALVARHPNPFHRLERSVWDSAVAATAGRIATLDRDRAAVALMELVALVRDGHTAINPIFDPAAGPTVYPLVLEAFADGLFVRAAAPEYRALVGGRVDRFGRVDAAAAMAAVARVVPHENDGWVQAWGPTWLTFPTVAAGMGLTEPTDRLTVVVTRDGRQTTATLKPVPRLTGGHNPFAYVDQTGWIDLRTAPAPLRQQQPERPYFADYDAGARRLYVAYRMVTDGPGERNAAFWNRVFALADSVPVDRFILDLRDNPGGNSFFNRTVVRGLVARPALDRPDRLFVLIGNRTFSAAMNLVRDLEQWTNATFVGEPTGNATFFYGDHERVTLPASGLTVAISTLPWRPYDPRDRRDFIAPRLYTPLTSDDYRAGRDPALAAIDRMRTEPPLGHVVGEALERGDSTAAKAAIRRAAADPVRRFNSAEAELNALGYRFLNARDPARAITVFRLNAEAFPRSANTWDSLGEALLAAGDRDGAITAYRRALTIDPSYAPSRQALSRLGVGPEPPDPGRARGP